MCGGYRRRLPLQRGLNGLYGPLAACRFPFLENVALKSRAAGRAEVRRSYEALFRAFPDLAPTSSGEAYGDDAFVNVVPFHNGRMQGEQLFFDLPELCRGIGLAVDDVVRQAAAAQAAT